MAAIEIEGLTKDYGEVLANDDVTFAVEAGEVFGYLGPNGAGKTTTIRTLLGLLSPTAGSARLLGRDVTDERALIEAKRRVGYLPDTPQFDEAATGREILDLHAAIKGDERSDELLDLFDPPLSRPVREYSHGNVRKLGLVTTFMHDPDLVILDEPTGGLDPLMKQRFADFVRGERDRGLTVFFSSHILGEVRRLCDRVGIIRSGRLVTVEPIDSLLDRSGKVVRVVGADPIPRSVFERDLAGVHDLEAGVGHGSSHDAESGTGSDGGTGAGADPESSADSGDRPGVETATGPPGDGTVTESGGGTVTESGGGAATESGGGAATEYTFTFTGTVDALCRTLSGYDLVDLTIEEAPLEDVFLRFYGGEDGA